MSTLPALPNMVTHQLCQKGPMMPAHMNPYQAPYSSSVALCLTNDKLSHKGKSLYIHMLYDDTERDRL